MTDGPACVPNIGPRQRRMRRTLGFAMLAAAAIAAAALIATGAPRVARALVFLPLLVGAIGLRQVGAQTCVALAARGLRNMDDGDERITDPVELRLVRAQARRIYLQAAGAAAAATAAVMALP